MKRVFLMIALAVTVFTARASARPEAPPEANPHSAEGVAQRTAEAGEAGTAEHGEKSAPLLPSNGQEFQEYFLQPAIWTIVIFVILLIALIPTAWKNVLVGLKSREQRIRSDIADAEAARTKA